MSCLDHPIACLKEYEILFIEYINEFFVGKIILQAKEISGSSRVRSILDIELNIIFSCIKESLEYKEENIEALYLLGVSYLWLAQYQSAQTELVRLIEKEGSAAKCSVLILLSTVYKKMGDIPSAIKTVIYSV